MADGLPVERLRQYLRELKPEARVLLRDANPGVDNVVYLSTKNPLKFEIHCAELCGLWHGYMFDTGNVVGKSAFASWVKRQQAYFGPVMKYLPPYATSYLPDPQKRAG